MNVETSARIVRPSSGADKLLALKGRPSPGDELPIAKKSRPNIENQLSAKTSSVEDLILAKKSTDADG